MTGRTILFVILIFIGQIPRGYADIISADNARESGDYETAIAEYTALAQAGNAVAQATLGYMLYVGEGISQDYKAAIRWYRQSAQQGNADAQYNLAVAYAFGEGIDQNFIEAVSWYTRAAEQDHAIAQYSLGLSYSFGEGVEQNAEDAAYWLSRSAENGYARAQVLLGSKYHTGNGVPLDYEEAARWYTMAAEQGDPIAQFNLGSMYRSGTGVAQNLIESRRWYQLSSDQGYEAATIELNNIDRTLASSQRNLQQTPSPVPENTAPTSGSEMGPVAQETVEELATDKESEVAQEETTSGGLFGRLFGGRSSSEDEAIIETADESEILIEEETTADTFAYEPGPAIEVEPADQPDVSEAVILNEGNDGLMAMGAIDAALPEETSTASAELLESDSDIEGQNVESRGFFNRLFSRSGNNQDAVEPDAEEVEVPVEDYSTTDNETIEPAITEEPTTIDEPEVAQEEISSGGPFGRLFGGRSSSEAEQIDESSQADATDEIPAEPELIETETAQAEQSSGGFFNRIFGGNNSNETNVEEVAISENESYSQTSFEPSENISIDEANNLYERGIYEFERKNYGDAAKNFQSAAAQGNLMAQYRLATLFHQGLGKEQDYSQAALWYRRAAEQGNVDAQYSLGNMYLMGEGIPQDDRQARYWYNQAAQQGHEAAEHNVNNIDRFSENNITITEDIAAQILGIDDSMNISMDESLDLGINQNDEDTSEIVVASATPISAQPAPSSLAAVDYERGLAYAFGEGVTKDLKIAFQYFKQAAEKNYAPAQYKIGVAYAYAEGTSTDKDQAAYWYEKAAMQGHTIAQRNLGVMLENGDGINQDKIKALAWYNILAKSGNVMDIRRRDNLSSELSQVDITESDHITVELQDTITEVN